MSAAHNQDSEDPRHRVMIARRVVTGYSVAVVGMSIAVGYALGGDSTAIVAGCIAAIAMAAVVVVIRRLFR